MYSGWRRPCMQHSPCGGVVAPKTVLLARGPSGRGDSQGASSAQDSSMVKQKVDPLPTALSTQVVPPISSVRRWEIPSPSPASRPCLRKTDHNTPPGLTLTASLPTPCIL